MLTHRKRLEAQGYWNHTDEELSAYTFGIRFAYIISTLFVTTGLIFSSSLILAIPLTLALLGLLLPRHPLDYLYNHLIRKLIGKPEIPQRPPQVKFVFGMASCWLGGIILLFNSGLTLWGYLGGSLLLVVAILVSTTDICIPSLIYNFIFKIKTPSYPKN